MVNDILHESWSSWLIPHYFESDSFSKFGCLFKLAVSIVTKLTMIEEQFGRKNGRHGSDGSRRSFFICIFNLFQHGFWLRFLFHDLALLLNIYIRQVKVWISLTIALPLRSLTFLSSVPKFLNCLRRYPRQIRIIHHHFSSWIMLEAGTLLSLHFWNFCCLIEEYDFWCLKQELFLLM